MSDDSGNEVALIDPRGPQRSSSKVNLLEAVNAESNTEEEAPQDAPNEEKPPTENEARAAAMLPGAPVYKPIEVPMQAVEFEAAPAFQGARSGMVFKLGSKGLGYYLDGGIQCDMTVCSYQSTGVAQCPATKAERIEAASAHYDLLKRAKTVLKRLKDEAAVMKRIQEALESDNYSKIQAAAWSAEDLLMTDDVFHTIGLGDCADKCNKRLSEIEAKRTAWRERTEAQLAMLIEAADLDALQNAMHMATDGVVINGTRISLSPISGIGEGAEKRVTLGGKNTDDKHEVHLEDLDKIGHHCTPDELASTYSKHVLLTIASEALEAIASTESDDLDKVRAREKQQEEEAFNELGIPMKESLLDTEVLVHHLEEEIDDLAMLDEAFAHLAERFKNRLSVRLLDDKNHEMESVDSRDHDIEEHLGHDEAEEVDKLKKRMSKKTPIWKMNMLANVLTHHQEEIKVTFWKLPKVRGYHEDSEHEHDVDWADLFFDLTYVAAAYQLGTLLKSDVTWLGFFYFAVMALCMMDVWKFKTLHDSTFESHDVYHKIVDAMYAVTAACAAVFIRSHEELEDQRTGHLYGFCFALMMNSVVLLWEKAEIFFLSTSKSAPRHTKNEIMFEVLPRLVFFMIATIVALIGKKHANRYYAHHDDFDPGVGMYNIQSTFSVIMFLFSSNVVSSIIPLLGYIAKVLPLNPIPWHYHHIAHRYGEWIMLMLGESILSMILTPVVQKRRFYIAFTTGIVTVQIMQLVHFESEEFDPSQHALSRKLRAGRIWLQLMAVYSISLIAFGVGLKAHLYYIVCDDGADYGYGGSSYGGGGSSYSSYSSSSYSSYESTYSSSSYESTYSSYSDRRQLAASGGGGYEEHGYCTHVPLRYSQLLFGAAFTQYVALQWSITLHEGMGDYMKHFYEYSASSAYIIQGMKLLTLAILLAMVWIPDYVDMQAHELFLVLLAVTIVQGLLQTLENMIVHMRRQDHGTTKRAPTASLADFYRGGAGTTTKWDIMKLVPGSPRSPKSPSGHQSDDIASPTGSLPSTKSMFTAKDHH